MTDSTELNSNYVIQSLLQRADKLNRQPYGLGSTVTVLGDGRYAASNVIWTGLGDLSDLNNFKIEAIDEATANQILRSLSTTNGIQQYQRVNAGSAAAAALGVLPSARATRLNYTEQLFHDLNPLQVVRRPATEGSVTYRQNVSVRYLQPPPVPPPGPLVIKEVRPPQPPPPPPLVVRQRAPPLPTPPPLVLREQPPEQPAPIPTQTIIKTLPPIPVPPRSVVIERYPAAPPRPRDIFIERWLPYQKTKKRKVIVCPAPPPRPYPPTRNTVIVYDPVQANVVRSVQKLGVQQQNPQEYALQYGSTLLDTATLVAQLQNLGITEDLNPPLSGLDQQYQSYASQYYLNTAQGLSPPECEDSTSSWENQAATNNERAQVYWSDPYEDVRVTLQRLGLTTE